MAFTKHKFTLDGVEHQINTPVGSKLGAAIAQLIDEHATAMSTPQWYRYLGRGHEQNSQRWYMRMVGGQIETYDVVQVED